MCVNAGLYFLHVKADNKQANSRAVYGQPRAIHSSPKRGLDRGSTDEGSVSRLSSSVSRLYRTKQLSNHRALSFKMVSL
jgi:hypothetical protein